MTITFEVLPEGVLSVGDSVFGTLTVSGPDQFSGPTQYATSPLVNTAPIARPDGVYRVVHNQTLITGISPHYIHGLLSNDWDHDGDTLSISLNSLESATNNKVTRSTDYGGAVEIDVVTGHFTYTPADDYVGGDSFLYTAIDSAGNESEPVLVTIDVTNEPPETTDSFYSVLENTAQTNPANVIQIAAFGTDADGDPRTASLVTTTTNGTLTSTANPSVWNYQPNIGFRGWDTAVFSISDGYASTDLTVSILVTDSLTPIDWNRVVAVDDEYTWYGGQLAGTVSTGDYSLEGNAISFSGTNTSEFTLNSDGTFTFTPSDPKAFIAANGATFTYTVFETDNPSISDTGTLTILPHVLKSSEAVFFSGTTVQNSTPTAITGSNDVIVWFEGGTAHLLGGSPDGHYRIEVTDGDNDPNVGANAVWYNGGRSVYLLSEGFIQFDVMGIYIGGDRILRADGSINFLDATTGLTLLSARTLDAISETGIISDVITTDRLLQVSAYGDVGDVTSAKTAYVVTSATGNIGDVTVTQGDLWFVDAALTVGDVTVQNGHLGSLHVGQDYSKTVTVSNDIGSVFIDGNLTATAVINATGNIGTWKLSDLSSVYFYNYNYHYFGAPGGPSATVQALIDASPLGDLNSVGYSGVFVGGSINANITATSGSIGVVIAEGGISSSLSAGTSILFVWSNTDSITGAITATGRLRHIRRYSINGQQRFRRLLRSNKGLVNRVTRKPGHDVENELCNHNELCKNRRSLPGTHRPAPARGDLPADQHRRDCPVCGDLRSGRFCGDRRQDAASHRVEPAEERIHSEGRREEQTAHRRLGRKLFTKSTLRIMTYGAIALGLPP
ncbi:MAG: hypothetical protein Tsb009_39230 [Planctomycetaceae bacterium]